MGASLSSDVYQYKVDSHLEAIEQYVAIVDDIITYGYNDDGSDHDKTVRDIMKKAQEVGMCFNSSECQFKKTGKILWNAIKQTRSDTRAYKN